MASLPEGLALARLGAVGPAVAAGTASRRGTRRRDALLLGFAVFAPLAVVAGYDVSGDNGLVRGFRLLVAAIVAWRAGELWRTGRRLGLGHPFGATAALFALWLLEPTVRLLAGDLDAALRGARFVLYMALWCAPLWLAFLAVPDTRALRRAVARVDLLGLLVAGSVYLAALLGRFGIAFGDVVGGGDLARVFGPLGDMVGYLLLFFLLREVARRSWGRFALFLGALVLGRTRGVAIALAVGLAALAWTSLRAAFRAGRGWELVQRFAGVLAAASLVAGVLAYSSAGRAYLERFGSWEVMAESGFAGRLRTFDLGIELFRRHPWLGIGPEAFARVVEREDLSWSHEDLGGGRGREGRLAYASTAQNQVLQIAAESGLVGLVGFLLWAAVAVSTARRACELSEPALRDFLIAVHGFTCAILIGLQSAVYLIDKSSIAAFLMLLLGLAARAALGAEASVRSRGPFGAAFRHAGARR